MDKATALTACHLKPKHTKNEQSGGKTVTPKLTPKPVVIDSQTVTQVDKKPLSTLQSAAPQELDKRKKGDYSIPIIV